MFLAIGLVIVTHLVVPVFFLVWLWRGGEKSKLEWLLTTLTVLFYSVHIFLVGRWDFFGYFLRFVLGGAFLVVTFRSLKKLKPLPVYPARNLGSYVSLGISSLIALLFLGALVAYIPNGYVLRGESVELFFPLGNGTYYVGHGGSSPVLNHHHVNAAQRYALDIVKLNRFGTRATGLYPSSLPSYTIFAEPLYSPCDGTVTEAVGDLSDLTPPESDGENLAGNHVLMQCPGADVVLAHLQRGSLLVQPGDNVRAGDAIARIGNSGNITEPHLHIHARKPNPGATLLEGEGLLITFDGRFLVRNSLFFGQDND
ncbi:MAG TPA: M23 family metallopeptidase [Nodosilinea sp.]|nr:M23 family metallopeptidase [Nodosilinea sp.]